MSTLLKTNFRRYFRHPMLWAAVLVSVFFGAAESNDSWFQGSSLYMNLDDMTFLITLFAQSAVLALLVTSQHKDGIFRSKVIAGYPKGKVFFAELVTGLTVSVLLYAACMIPLCVLAYRPLKELPLRNTLAGAGALLLIFLSVAALTVLLCSQMRGRILALALSMGAVFLLYAANYFCDDALHTPEKTSVTLKLISNQEQPSWTYDSRHGSLRMIHLPASSGVHWSEEGILVGKDSKPVDIYGNPLEEGAKPVFRESPNPKYIGGPLRIVLSVADCINPVRPMSAALLQFYISQSPDTTAEMLKEDERMRNVHYELLPQYLPWQIGTLTVFCIAGWLLFRKKELN